MKSTQSRFAFLFLIASLAIKSQVSFSLSALKCKSDTVSLLANINNLSNPSYTWACVPSGAAFSASNNQATNLIFQNSGTYTVSLIVTSGSSSFSAQNTVTVNPLPAINLSASSLTTCIIGNIIPNSKPIIFNASGGVNYTWTPPNGSITGGQNGPLSTFRPLANTCFSVLGVDANGCKNQAVSCVSVLPRFTISAAPQNPTLCTGGTSDEYVILTASNPLAPAAGLPASHKYFWSGGQSSGILTTPLSPSVAVAPSSFYTYTVEMVDSLGCISIPKLVPVFVQVCAGLNDEYLSANLKGYPNPVKDKLLLTIENSKEAELVLTVINTLGQPLKANTKLIDDNLIEVDFTNLVSGVYYLEIISAKHSSTLRIIKE